MSVHYSEVYSIASLSCGSVCPLLRAYVNSTCTASAYICEWGGGGLKWFTGKGVYWVTSDAVCIEP